MQIAKEELMKTKQLIEAILSSGVSYDEQFLSKTKKMRYLLNCRNASVKRVPKLNATT